MIYIMPCTVFILFHILNTTEYKRELSPLPQVHCSDNGTLTNTTPTSNIPLEHIPRNRSERAFGLAAIASAALPAIGKLATLAVEELGAYLQRKRNNALKVALQELDREKKRMRNEMHLLEKDFLLYGEFDVNSTRSIIELLDSLDNRTSYLERILQMKVTAWNEKFLLTVNGPAMYSHVLQLYTDNLREKYDTSSVNVLISSRDVIFSDNVVYFYNFFQIFCIPVYCEIAFLVPP